ncbi:MAG TPA: class I SAM-dependent methyltransferase, partial [Flavobacterium sp.]
PGMLLEQAKQTQSLIYFDGNHSKIATLNYFELLLPTITNESVWIFDDIHWSSAMEEAWEIIKKHPKVTVTIDTFQWGLVFFRREQEKEHFVIRI